MQATQSTNAASSDADDNYGRLEFNMGAQGSTSTIYIKNVRIEIVE